jgi:hypothetical protein
MVRSATYALADWRCSQFVATDAGSPGAHCAGILRNSCRMHRQPAQLRVPVRDESGQPAWHSSRTSKHEHRRLKNKSWSERTNIKNVPVAIDVRHQSRREAERYNGAAFDWRVWSSPLRPSRPLPSCSSTLEGRGLRRRRGATNASRSSRRDRQHLARAGDAWTVVRPEPSRGNVSSRFLQLFRSFAKRVRHGPTDRKPWHCR